MSKASTDIIFPGGSLIHDLFETQVAQKPTHPAMVFGDRSMSYQEFSERSNQLAHFLIAKGVQPETHVAICMDRSFDIFIGIMGIIKAGAAYCPIDPAYPSDRKAFMLSDTNANIILTQSHLLSSLSANDWGGFIPKENNPKDENPAKGFLASANQRSADLSYPYYYHGNFDDYRGRMLDSTLRLNDAFSVENVKELQLSNFSIHAKESLAAINEQIGDHSFEQGEQEIFNLLNDWNYSFEADGIEGTCFKILWDNLYKMTWDEFEEIDNGIRPEKWKTIALLQEPDHPFFDILSTEEKELAHDVVLKAFMAMCKKVEEIDDENLKWGNYKNSQIRHLARIPAFGREIKQVGGYMESLNAMTKYNGPSWRMIVELEKDDMKAQVIYPGGQSGNPFSPYYDNFIEDWATGKYHDVKLYDSTENIDGIFEIHLNKAE